jgi:hypothetical protein
LLSPAAPSLPPSVVPSPAWPVDPLVPLPLMPLFSPAVDDVAPVVEVSPLWAMGELRR